LEYLSFLVGADITPNEFWEAFAEKVIPLSNGKIFIPSFVEFQYRGDLNPNNRVHASVLSELAKHGINCQTLKPTESIEPPDLAEVEYADFREITKGHASPLQGAKDKDKDKDKDKKKDKEQDKEKEKARARSFDFQAIYAKYPRKMGKQKGFEKLKRDVKTEAAFQALEQAVSRFVAHHAKARTEGEFIPHFSTWVSSWRDWCDPETGTDVVLKESEVERMARLEREIFGDNQEFGP
jgi:hypothetical protein